MKSLKISSWGRLSNHYHNIHDFENLDKLKTNLLQVGITFGNGRSYGDVCLNANGNLFATRGHNQVSAFDDKNGLLICDPGLLLSELLEAVIPLGWFLPVLPGTQFATIGGAIANDVHGKGHDFTGTFGDNVISFDLLRTNGEIIQCSREENFEFFQASIGGFGLTGYITNIKLQLMQINSTNIDAKITPFYSLDEFFNLSRQAKALKKYSVGWIDCISFKRFRGIFNSGYHSNDGIKQIKRSRITYPFNLERSLVNKLTLKPFNNAYFYFNKFKNKNFKQHYSNFFFPLDAILKWNRLYGKKGFYQYQSVVPEREEFFATKEMLKAIEASGTGSFIAVLKKFGERKSSGLMSFPMRGTTLALDFPSDAKGINHLFKKLDDIVLEAGGRLYLAKDARMSREMFQKTYPNINHFLKFRDHGMVSDLSRRLID